MTARLPNGAPVVKIELHFTTKEMEFIKCRYERCLTIKEVAVAMNVSGRMAKWYSASVIKRLGFHTEPGDQYPTAIRITKFLLLHKLIALEDV
jgi:hypothetical protein